MKNINILFSFAIAAILSSCSRDFGDINNDPRRLTETTIPSLLTSLESQINGRDFTFLAVELDFPASQLTAKVRDIGVDPINRASNSMWGGYYSFLADQRALEELMKNYEGDQETLVNIKGMVKTLSAFRTMNNLDVYGDMPYSQAGYAFSNSNQVFRPVYDKQVEVYKTMLEELKWASGNYKTEGKTPSGESYYSPGGNDIFYSGNVQKWMKLTNSLLLKMAVKVYDKEPSLAGPIIADILNNNKPLLEEGEDWKIAPKDAGITRSFNPSFTAAGSAGARLGETVWNYLSSGTAPADTNGAKIFDYRARIYFEPNAYDSWYPAQQEVTVTDDFGNVYAGGRANNPQTNRSRYSAINIFLVTDNTNVPDIFLTAAEVNFYIAEAYARGLGVTKDWSKAQTNHNEGIAASVKFWSELGQVLLKWTPAKGQPGPATAADIALIQNNPKVAFLPTDTEEQKLKKLYAQHWLALFWQPWDAFYLMRRTLLTPKTVPYNTEYYRLVYPQAEIGDNKANYEAAVASMGGDDKGIKLWWMK